MSQRARRASRTGDSPSTAPEAALRAALALPQSAPIAGVDEAGRGAWAGPVCAAAVILPADLPDALARRLDDSKRLRAEEREALSSELRTSAAFALGWAGADEIDAVNILQATLLAMTRALAALHPAPAAALIDGAQTPPTPPCPARALVRGDSLSLAVAAASILAKTARDARLKELDADWPGYGFASHVGYGTPAHRAALARLGPAPIHRFSYKPVAAQAAAHAAARTEAAEVAGAAEAAGAAGAAETARAAGAAKAAHGESRPKKDTVLEQPE